jgi:poly-gamma-glutamate capsule biosynthesis protein CapA/YwtB (metallophosphatase superfamily)
VLATPTICLLGDVMLGRKVAETLATTPAAEVWSAGVREACAACDALVVNVECCVSTRGTPTSLIPEKPFFFRAPPSGVEVLRAIGASVAGLANNHALDFGVEALADTLEHLRAGGIVPVGAGAEVDSARRGVVVPAGRLRLGVLALSDHPVEYEAGRGRPGVAHADLRRALPTWVTTEVRRLRSEADVVLAFPHWGSNMSASPARWQVARARELLTAGADAVAGHSAHVFHGVALTPAGPALYDLGGAIDDYAIDEELRNDLGVLAEWRPQAEPEVQLTGLRLGYCRTELAAGADAEWIARRLQRACAKLGTSVERLDKGRFALLRRNPHRVFARRRYPAAPA